MEIFLSICALCLLHSFSCKKFPRCSKPVVKRHPCFCLETTYHGWWDNPTRFISIIWEQWTRISKCLVFRQTLVFLQPECFMQIMYLQFKLTVYWTWHGMEFPCFTFKFQYSQCNVFLYKRADMQGLNPSHAAIKISINATAAEFICKNIFPTPVQIKKIIKNKIGDIQQIYLYQNVCK